MRDSLRGRLRDLREREVRGRRWIASAVLGALSVCGCPAPEPASGGAALYERKVEGNVFGSTPVRGEPKPLRLERVGFEYKCTECHNSIVSPLRQNALIGTHADVRLDHGMNNMCLNCHHPANRDAFVDYDGNEIPATESQRLCAKCHGPTYREWEIGIHGRQNGYWDTSRGPRVKLVCIQCHEPHHPKFRPMQPEPPPRHSRFAHAPRGDHP